MSINIKTEFDYAGSIISVELYEARALVCLTKGKQTVTLEDSEGDVADWHHLYQNKWAQLSGYDLGLAEKTYAKEYGIEALGNWVVLTQEEIDNGVACE